MTSQQQINDLKKRARHLRKLAARAREQGLREHADTLDGRAAEVEQRVRSHEALGK
jgi:hypothetical protein